MALATVTDALAQYNANSDWPSPGNASLALQAIRFLIVNRAQMLEDQGSRMNFEQLEKEKAALEKYTGATTPRANGRSRRVTAGFSREGIQ